MGIARARLVVVGAAVLLVASVLPTSPAAAAPGRVDAPAARGSAGPAAASSQAPGDRSARAARPACTVRGTSRPERLVGTPGRDVICGGGGADVLVGRGGDDVLRGGAGRDTLLGGGGDDLLDGGPAGDQLQGGPGPDTCLIDVEDRPESCDYDRTGPAISTVALSRDAVDVTDGPQTVVVTMRVTDDTGVRSVALRPEGAPRFPTAFAERVSGSARDGLYSARVTFPRYVPGGTYRPIVQAYDELGRDTRRTPQEQVEVTDATPDTEHPEAQVLSPDPDRVFDTRTSGASVPVRVRLTDALSGVDPDQVGFGLWAPRTGGAPDDIEGGRLELLSGDLHDGVWGTTVDLRRLSKGGVWSIGVFVGDRANRGSDTRAAYWGPGEYPHQDEVRFDDRAFPDGRGGVRVLGREHDDATPPTLADVRIDPDPSAIDTRTREVPLRVSARASDLGSGVDEVSVQLAAEDSSLQLGISRRLARVSGNAADGRWVGTIPVPRGTPPGRYHLTFYVDDRAGIPAYFTDIDDPTVDYAATDLDIATIVVVDSTPR